MSSRAVYGIAGILALAAAYACFCRAPLIWDGAYQFNATLIMQRPYFYLTRFHTFFLWWPTVWASRVTANVNLLQAIYGLPFLLAPVAAVLLSWWMVRKYAPGLMVWAIFGIAIAPLPGQIFVINDSIFQLHLFWPIFMGMLVPLNWPKRIVLAALAVFQFVHPLGILLLGGGAAAAAAVGVADRGYRRRMFWRAAILAALCLLAAAKIVLTNRLFPALRDTFAEQEATWHTALDRWYAGVMGWPLRGLWLMWGAAAMTLLYGLPRRQWSRRALTAASLALILAGAILFRVERVHPAELWFAGGALVLIYLCMLLVGGSTDLAAVAASLILMAVTYLAWKRVVDNPTSEAAPWAARGASAILVLALLAIRRSKEGPNLARLLIFVAVAGGAACWIYWAADGRLWWKALDYRRWVGPLAVPFFLLATMETCLVARSSPFEELAAPEETRPIRKSLGLILAAVFAIVLGAQCTVWHSESDRLLAAVGKYPSPLAPVTAFAWIDATPLDHWGTADFVMAMQGKRPSKLLIFMADTEDNLYEHPPKVPLWTMYPHAKTNGPDPAPGPVGWFDLRPLIARLQKSPRLHMPAGPAKFDRKSTPD